MPVDHPEKMKTLFDRPDLAKEMGKRAYEKVKECYTDDKVYQQYMDLFNEIIKEKVLP